MFSVVGTQYVSVEGTQYVFCCSYSMCFLLKVLNVFCT